MDLSWQRIRRLFARPAVTRKASAPRRTGSFVPQLEDLERREVLTVSVQNGFEGIFAGQFAGQLGISPPDTDLAVGPSQVIESVNVGATMRTKAGKVISSVDFNQMFPPLSLFRTLFDPVTVYDESAQRFYICILEVDNVALTSFLRIAVSNTSTVSNFTTDWTERQNINLVQLDTTAPFNGLLWGDFPRVGYNADALIVTVNKFSFITNQFDHASVIAIRKSTILDRQNATLQVTQTDRLDVDFTMVPARMHDSVPGGPMYFLGTVGIRPITQDFSDTALRFTTMTNVVSVNPGFQVSEIAVPNYGNGHLPDTIEPGDGSTIFPQITVGFLDTRMLSVAWRGNHLVAAHNANNAGQAEVQWLELDTSTPIPTVLQTGVINPGPGIFSYNPAIDIAKNYDIGMTYQQNSLIEFPSMYVTGRSPRDPKGQMEAPVRVRQGELSLVNSNRTGDYAGIAVDPLNPNQFWAAHEYGSAAISPVAQGWATWIAAFSVTPLLPSQLKTVSPARLTYNPTTGTFDGFITIMNPLPQLTGRFTLQIFVFDASISLVRSGAVRVGNTYSFVFNGPIQQNLAMRIPISLRNPLHRPMGNMLMGAALGVF
jgi:hypothetical protein